LVTNRELLFELFLRRTIELAKPYSAFLKASVTKINSKIQLNRKDQMLAHKNVFDDKLNSCAFIIHHS
jgi:hypothetical protein